MTKEASTLPALKAYMDNYYQEYFYYYTLPSLQSLLGLPSCVRTAGHTAGLHKLLLVSQLTSAGQYIPSGQLAWSNGTTENNSKRTETSVRAIIVYDLTWGAVLYAGRFY